MAHHLVRLMDALFASTLDTPPWTAFLEALGRYMPCQHPTLVLRKPRPGDPGVVVSADAHTDAIVALQERVFRDSPFLELPQGEVCVLSEMMSPAELARRFPVYHAYLHEYGEVIDLIGLDLADPATGMIFRLRGARRQGEARFGEAQRGLLEALAPRLQTAFAIYARLAHQQYRLRVLDDTAEQLTVGCLVLNEDGRVLLKNAVADRWLEQQDGFAIREGTLHCTDTRSERAMRHALATVLAAGDAAQGASQVFRAARGGGAQSWSVLCRPHRVRAGLGDKTTAAVLVLIRDANQRPEISVGVLIELFRLTRAEAVLATRLVQGESVKEAAASLGISHYTARAQLAAIFGKTDTHRQPQLVSHILHTVHNLWP
ncbi:helix-turn-helix transcriptional regulator [Paraburkholderia oxyphila]|uniref:helix-turn-helix transcriptional regulator n=1 Tax=Paraburkholderia oxyphila TaxID=614212 RepID=UPI0004842D97|nr:helix-turn-helix transcriptional regulator [Paraburkholderia oxyphila]